MSRRRAPRPAGDALRAALQRAAPQTGLAAAQAVWVAAVGEGIAAVTEPVAERDGELVIACADPVWVQELDLMQGQLLEGLRRELGESAPRRLRFRVQDH